MNNDTKIIIEHLIKQGMTKQEAIDYFKDMRRSFLEFNTDPEELLYEIGLEPDYIFGLIL